MLILEDSVIPYWIVLLLITGVFVYIYYSWYFGLFRSQGVPGPRPRLILGTSYSFLTKGIVNVDPEYVHKYGKMIGLFEGRVPVLMITDENLIRQVMVRDFSIFTNRRPQPAFDVVTSKLLLHLHDGDWRRVRRLVTPSFSSGKLKNMTSHIDSCAQTLTKNGCRHAQLEETVEMKDFTGAFALDSIAVTAFGLHIDSLNSHRENAFVAHAKLIHLGFRRSPVAVIAFFLPFLVPLLRWLKMTLYNTKNIAFFSKVTKDAIESRQNMRQPPVDFLQLMLNAHSDHLNQNDHDLSIRVEGGSAQTLTRDEIYANSILFFLAGYETTSTAMSMLLYHLALNPEIQNKLWKEIHETVGQTADIDYTLASKLMYLDMCIQEALRLHPPIPRVYRSVGQDTHLGGVFMPKGSLICVPIYAIHHDPSRWPDPDKFDPDRFIPELRGKRNPFHHIPFGYGPRNCIGMRLALLEIKISIIQLLRRLEFRPCERTQVPLVFANTGLLQTRDGVWLSVRQRY